ncbi:LysM peptidoglycan-binding domain-containing protein [Marinilabilia salmonicolor]|uniref:LysM peptidoglycan-binding domain-containing protein n=1 Tax=Marinilabilia salmonicolor TaxID=989 RepID=UPI0009DF58CA|nr:LysM domain-containing protein [Marinilabilia salmonicolor]
MPHYNDVYISPQDFEICLHHGMRYDGFVEGLGYAYTSNFTIPPIHFQKYNPPGRVSDDESFFQNGFVQYLDTSSEVCLMSVKYQHKVKTGDTLTSISGKYGVSIQSIMDANSGIDWEGREGDRIFAGEKLELPRALKQPIGNKKNECENTKVTVSAKTHNGKFRIEVMDAVSVPFGSLGEMAIMSDMDAVTGFWETTLTTGINFSTGLSPSSGVVTAMGGEIKILKNIEASSLMDWANKSGLVSIASGQFLLNYSKFTGLDPKTQEKIWVARGFGCGLSIGYSGSRSVNEYRNGDFYYRHDRYPNEVVYGLSPRDSLKRAANDPTLTGRDDFLREKGIGENELEKYK